MKRCAVIFAIGIFVGIIFFIILIAQKACTENEIDCRYKGRHDCGNVQMVAINGDYAYIADRSYNCLRIIDVSEKTNPQEIDHIYGNPHGIAVAGDYTYITYASGGLDILDISDPYNPTRVGHYDDEAGSVAISGDYAYISTGGNRFILAIIDITDKANPKEVGRYKTNDSVEEVAIAGNYAYVANYNSLTILDISNKTAPKKIGQYDAEKLSHIMEVAVADNYAYISYGQNNGERLYIISTWQSNPPSTKVFNSIIS